MRNVLCFLASFVIFLVLVAMALVGLNDILMLDFSAFDWIYYVDVFNQIFTSTALNVIIMEIPFFAGVLFSLAYFAKKDARIILLVLEIAAIIVICLSGFGIITPVNA